MFLIRRLAARNAPSMRIFIPDDIERLIFELAVRDDRHAALRLVRVARRAQYWIDPLLYRTVVLDTEAKAVLFLRTLHTSTKPAIFFARTVRTLYLRFVPGPLARAIASACMGVASLTYEGAAPTLAALAARPRRLSAHLARLLGMRDGAPDLRAPLLRRVTHLQHVGAFREWGAWAWTGVEALPALTHLALRVYPGEARADVCGRVRALVRRCAGLKVLVLLVSGEVESVRGMALGEVDSRVVVGDLRGVRKESEYWGVVVSWAYPGGMQDWGHVGAGDAALWEQAEEIVRRRETGTVGGPALKRAECTVVPKVFAEDRVDDNFISWA